MVTLGSAGVLAPGGWRWARVIGWMIALSVGIVAAFNAAAKGVLLLIGAAEPAATDKLVAALAGIAAAAGVYAIAVRFGERRRAEELDVRRAPIDLLAGIAVGSALIGAVVALQWLLGWVTVEQRQVDGIALALRDALRSGVIEELLFRAVLFRLLWRAFGIWPAIAVAAALFGVLHLGNPGATPFAAACLIAGEGVAIGLYLLTGRIWASIGMHAAWNFTQGWLLGAAVSGTDEIAGGPLSTRAASGVDALLSGGTFGPEASLPALLLSLAASLFFLHRAWAHGRFVAADEAYARGKAATAS